MIDFLLSMLSEKSQKQRQLPLTLSMGFSYGDGNHDEIGKVALLNLNLAEVRGGDQVVVKENDETKIQFILVVGLLLQSSVPVPVRAL